MEILKFIYAHGVDTVCFLAVIFFGLTAVVMAFKGKNIW